MVHRIKLVTGFLALWLLIFALLRVASDFLVDSVGALTVDDIDTTDKLSWVYFGWWSMWGSLYGLVCWATAKKMGLKARRFFICGFVNLPMTLSCLLIYPLIKSDNNQRDYNDYALFLGWASLIIYSVGWFVIWFI